MVANAPSYYQPGIIPQQELRADAKEAFYNFIQKITNPYTSVEELRYLFMRPVPPNIGQIQCTIVRHKSGFNRLWPKYTLQLSDGEKLLLVGKKRSGNTTSNYMICIDEAKMKKNSAGYLGKLRSNFLGTEFYIYDGGDNPKKAKNMEEARNQLGVVEYEKNVLGSKGPRRMKVLLPRIERDGSAFEWKPTDVRLPQSLNSPYYRKTILSRTCSRQAPKRTSSSSSTSLPSGMNVRINTH